MFELPFKQNQRVILHVDADAFFASVEQALNPRLKGKSVIVGGPSKKKGIVSACSYEAKKFGVYSGMPMFKATRACPKAIIVSGKFYKYREYSKKMLQIFQSITPDTEMVSVDEAYLDITGSKEMFGKSYKEIAKDIMKKIEDELGITVSIGMASNKTVAKVASSTNKPNKLTVIPFGKEYEFLSPLSLLALPGIGPKNFAVLKKYGLNCLADLADLSLSQVIEKFGVNSIPLWKRAKGVDNSEVKSYKVKPKSVSKEFTFYETINDKNLYLSTLRELSRSVFSRLRKSGQQASTVFVKIRYKINTSNGTVFRDFSFQQNLAFSSNADSDLFPAVKNLFEKNLSPHFPLRLVGVGVCNLSENYNLNLFSTNTKNFELFERIDRITELYGTKVLNYGV
ncbi:DNA polymerase IV [Candidatus Peregrinibacteria bacterium]|nr:DNA polymerase IV [Candidatus Peregrinibacteria bacterium]